MRTYLVIIGLTTNFLACSETPHIPPPEPGDYTFVELTLNSNCGGVNQGSFFSSRAYLEADVDEETAHVGYIDYSQEVLADNSIHLTNYDIQNEGNTEPGPHCERTTTTDYLLYSTLESPGIIEGSAYRTYST